MIRGVVFTIESDGGHERWQLGIAQTGQVEDAGSLPILLLGLSAIVVSSFRKDGQFNSPDDIENFFKMVEAHQELEIETADVWLPKALLRGRDGGVKRGDVFRVSPQLFGIAWRLRGGDLNAKVLLELTQSINQGVSFSGEETAAFTRWAGQQWRRLLSEPKNPALSLPRRENFGGSGATPMAEA
jgi:hypothetical protein